MGVNVGQFTKYLNETVKNANDSRNNQIENLKLKAASFKKIGELVENGQIKDSVNEIERQILGVQYTKDLMPIHSIKRFPSEIPMYTAKNVGEKISHLSKMFKNFEITSYYGYNDYLSWTAKVVMKHSNPAKNFGFEYDFGTFIFYFRMKVDWKPEVLVKPHAENKGLETGAYHPHVRADGKACIGTYADHIFEDMSKLDIFTVMQNITSIMEQYNPTSIYSEDIHSWIGQKCPVCFSFIGPTTKSARCEKSMQFMHESCAANVDGHYYNPLLLKKCTACSKESVDWVPVNNSILCKDCA